MPEYRKTLTLPYAAEDLFELVSDIRRYPQFIRWIKALRVKNEHREGERQICVGDAIIGFKGFTERFATHVIATPSTCSVDVRLANGPFRHLENTWRMVALPDGRTRLTFYIDYAFRNPLLRALAAANFDLAVDRIMTAFIDEAARRYAKVETGSDNLRI